MRAAFAINFAPTDSGDAYLGSQSPVLPLSRVHARDRAGTERGPSGRARNFIIHMGEKDKKNTCKIAFFPALFL